MSAPKEIILTTKNIAQWPRFEKIFREGKLVADTKGRIRYLHGAPVGKLILVGVNSNGTPKYKESAEEWFDPESQKSREFVWPN